MLSLLLLLAPSPAELEVTRADLEAHVRFLASDELEGRDTASPGGRAAADHLARALEEAGWSPAGDAGTFLQDIGLERRVAVRPATLVAVDAAGQRTAGVVGADFRVRSSGARGGDLAVRVVDSAADVPPEPDPGVALFFDATRRRAYALLEEAGHPEGSGFGALLLRGPSSRGDADDDLPRPRLAPRDDAREPAALSLRGPWLEAFRGGRVARVRFDAGVEVEPAAAANVVAVLRGETDEAVVLSAHYDHIGTRSPDPGAAGDEDLVFNGADDDASGVAAVLEIAEALGAGAAPERTLVALLVTGEERGLLGTRFYLEHPVVPLESTVCNLNFEMVGRPDELVGGPGVLWLSGWERTNLGALWSEAGVAADPRPEQDFFRRSDNYPFALRGIVAQTLSSYGMHTDYHRVTDEAETLDYAHMERAVRTALELVRGLADGSTSPEWLPGGRP